MALRGNLKDFTLPDVFQLIAASKKTGILRIVGPEMAEGSVWFRDGEVFFAQSNWHHEKLGERLVASQKITPSALARVLQIQKSEPAGRRIGQILVDEGYITAPVLEAFVQEQIQETVFDLMRWSEGEFDFELLPRLVDEDIGLTVSMENIIMEGSRRLEEWARIKRKVPSMDIVFRMATAPGEGTFEISLKPVEWNLLLLLDGTRSVAELARATGRTDFEVARIVYGLYSAGLLEVTPDDEVARLRVERAEREALRQAQEVERAAAAPTNVGVEPTVTPEPAALVEPGATGEPSEAEAGELATAEPSPSARIVGEPSPEVPPQVTEPQEVPAFLAGGAVAPAEEDMAVLEEMIESLLGRAEVPPSPGPAVSLEPEPEVPAEGSMQPPGPSPLEEAPAEFEPIDVLPPAADWGPVESPVSESIEFLPEEPAGTGLEFPTPALEPVPTTADETVRAFDELVEAAEAGPTEADTAPVPTSRPQEPGAGAHPELEASVLEAGEGEIAIQAEALVEAIEPASTAESVAVEAYVEAEPVSETAVEPAAPTGAGEVEVELERAEVEPTVETPVEVELEAAPGLTVDAEVAQEAAVPAVEFPDEQPLVEPEAVREVFVEPSEGPETYVEPASAPRASIADLATEEAELLQQPVAEPASIVLGSATEEMLLEQESVEETPAVVAEAAFEPVEGERALQIEPSESEHVLEILPAEQEEEESTAAAEHVELADLGHDAALAGSLSSEISALTGTGRARPAAVVRSLEPGAGRLHRDTAIDRDTLLKIIDGIKNL